MEKRHYELTDDVIQTHDGRTLHRIKCTEAFSNISEGELGGYIEKEENLSGDAQVSDDARVRSSNDYCVFQCFGFANRVTTAFKCKDGSIKIACGCFRGNIDEFAKQVKKTHGNNIYARQYEAIIEVIKLKFMIK